MPGVFDFFFFIPTHQYHGLFLEMKKIKDYTLSPEQLRFQQSAREKNYKAEFAYGWEHGRQIILDYLSSSSL